MQYLKHDKILEIQTEAVELGLHTRRNQLLAGLNNAFVATLNEVADPAGQMLSDLVALNKVPVIIDDEVPLYRWLRNAAYSLSFLPDKQEYFRALSDDVMAKRGAAIKDAAAAKPAAPPAAKSALDTLPEKVVFVNDMVPFGFLKGAERTGISTARLIVPSFLGGQPRNWPMSTKQKQYFGTGWLIGAKHVITNHHVINARDKGDKDAADSDFKLQGEGATVQFDYDTDNAEGLKFTGLKLCVASKPLDYAIVELPESSNRLPLPLWTGELALGPDAYVPVNIIQHPGGNIKQMGIRNNLAAKLTDLDLAYFTDTEGGSSGSAVCNDDWKVIALHKASSATFGDLEYQGKTTSWVNVGTRIDRIISDLKGNHSALWDQIGANVTG